MLSYKPFIVAAVIASLASSVGCAEEGGQEQTVPNKIRRLKEPWGEAELSIIRTGEKTPIRIKGRKATYEIELKPNEFHSTTVILFSAQKSGHLWLGPEADCYLESDAGIQGVKLRFGSLLWFDSLLKSSKAEPGFSEELDDHVSEFDRSVTNDQLLEEEWAREVPLLEKEGGKNDTKRKRRTHLSGLIKNPFFFAAAPMSSQSGEPKIVEIGIVEGLLKIDMASQTGVYKATSWIDISSRKAIRAEYDEFTWPETSVPRLTMPR